MSDETTRPVPTGPGWWWRGDAVGAREVVRVYLPPASRDRDSRLCFHEAGASWPPASWPVLDDGRWLAPVLSHTEAAALRRERDELVRDRRDVAMMLECEPADVVDEADKVMSDYRSACAAVGHETLKQGAQADEDPLAAAVEIVVRERDEALAALAEAEAELADTRPRPRVEWVAPYDTDPRPCWRAVLGGHTLAAVWLDPFGEWAWTRLDYGKVPCADLATGFRECRAHLLSFGLDVAEVPDAP